MRSSTSTFRAINLIGCCHYVKIIGDLVTNSILLVGPCIKFWRTIGPATGFLRSANPNLTRTTTLMLSPDNGLFMIQVRSAIG